MGVFFYLFSILSYLFLLYTSNYFPNILQSTRVASTNSCVSFIHRAKPPKIWHMKKTKKKRKRKIKIKCYDSIFGLSFRVADRYNTCLRFLHFPTRFSLSCNHPMSDFHRRLYSKFKTAEDKLGFDFSEDAEDAIDTDNNSVPESNDSADDIISCDWSDIFDYNDIYCDSKGYKFQTYYKEPKSINDEYKILFIGHHGAGSSGLTFSKLADEICKQSNISKFNTIPGFFTFDFRGHGKTFKLNQNDANSNYNISIDQLIDDFKFVFYHLLNKIITSNNLNPEKLSIFLVGHSLGGSVVCKYLTESLNQLSSSDNLSKKYLNLIKGLTLIDIVEETAIKSLPAMSNYLNNLPNNFPNLKSAIDWHIKNGLINNFESCKYSIPEILFNDKLENNWKFIIDLKKTEIYWNNWFKNLSSNFINLPSKFSKMLILANNDYLDKNLIIGQMQGKYQLVVFHSNNSNNLNDILTTTTKNITLSDSNKLGHFLQEDIPIKLSITLLEFVERNDNISFHKLSGNPQLDLINKLNAKWNIKK